ncbi:MAG: uracil-DNA glycosylase family protein [Bacteroidales bacterium]
MTIYQYQKKCYKEYRESINFPEHTYLYGNPINPVIPLMAATTGKVMVVGSFPSARLYFVDAIPDVPLYDANAPFSTEPYFDGSRVRTSAMGQALDEMILETIGVTREECWLTNLVKVFLFNEDQVKKYHRLGRKDVQENRSKFMEYANRSISWLRQEIEIANPYVIILLGAEVVSSLLLVSQEEAREYMTGEVIEKKIIWKNSHFICLPPPPLLMDRSPRNPWPRKFAINIGPRAMKEVERLRTQPTL